MAVALTIAGVCAASALGCPPSFGPPVFFELAGSQPHDIAVADFDLNGFADLAVPTQSDTGEVSVLLGDGSGSLPDGENFATGIAAYSKSKCACFRRFCRN